MTAKEELKQMEKVLQGMARLAKRRAKKHGVALVYAVDGKIVEERFDKKKEKK